MTRKRYDHRQITFGGNEMHDLVEVRVMTIKEAEKEWQEILRKKRKGK